MALWCCVPSFALTCRSMPATMPGTPATVSRKMMRRRYFFSSMLGPYLHRQVCEGCVCVPGGACSGCVPSEKVKAASCKLHDPERSLVTKLHKEQQQHKG